MPPERKKKWQQDTYEPAIGKSPERQPDFTLTSGMEISPLYTPGDIKGIDLEESPGYPGEYPFGRGIQPTMYRGRLWTMRQYSGFASAEESNRRYRYLLDQGQTGLSIAFDLPTQIGYDSDNPLARGEVGKVGVPIDTLKDMEILFQNIPLDKVSTSMTINATAPVLLAMYIALARKQGVALSELNGTVQNDILKEYIARGTYIFPPAPSMRLTTDIFEYCRREMPRWNTISISGYHMREAGSTAVQEIAFTLANGIAYVKAALDRCLDIDEFAGRLSFFFDAHNNLLEEVAKFRAARILWAKIMKERFGARDDRSWMLRFHTQTTGCSLTAQQPYNNIVRVALQALAAILGGTQSLHTNSYDEAYATPSEEAVTTALRTQQVLAYESGVADSIDPLGGSWMVEKLTRDIMEAAERYIDKIDSLGGVLAAIEKGYQQREIQESSYRYQKEVEAEKRVVVGVNKFATPYEKLKSLNKINPEEEKKQMASLTKVKQQRDSATVKASLENLRRVAAGNENTISAFIDCVEALATVGEICDTLREVFGIQREYVII
ncbi:MAG TPA: methylmalonyl-CoA mutase family protein [Dehalococcoidia bacterium]|nr:methylmalonyl-CoA mutase family protein [Dehalococcoidia bacterium]